MCDDSRAEAPHTAITQENVDAMPKVEHRLTYGPRFATLGLEAIVELIGGNIRRERGELYLIALLSSGTGRTYRCDEVTQEFDSEWLAISSEGSGCPFA
ncbi:hypothetical protein Trydic_g12467 [Trypoxylus dichotomus]